MKKQLSVLIVSLVMAANSLGATILVDSTFTTSATGAGGRNATNIDNLTPWFLVSSTSSANATVVNDSGVGGLGKALQVNSGNTIFTAFSAASLLEGEKIVLTLDYRFVATPTTGSETFRIGLFNANAATAVTADISPIASADLQQYVGYFAGLAIGGTPAGGTTFRKRNTANTNALTSTGSLVGIANNNSGLASGTTAHSLEFSIERTSGSSVTLTSKIDGTTFLTGIDSTGIYTTFNSLAIAGISGTVILDNVVLQVVPEPGSALLVFASGVALLLKRRRVS